MGATLKYGEWEFGPQMHYSKGGECHSTGGTVKKAMGGSCGGYKEGGTVKKASSKMCKAKGGKVAEKGTGEKYASKKEMMKHEKSESPREQRQEMTKGKIPVRKSVPVASQSPLIAMKKGGKCYAEGGKVNAEIAKARADRSNTDAGSKAAYARQMESNKARAIAEAQMRDNAARQARSQVQNMPSNANLQMAPSRNPATTNMNNPNTRQMDADKAYAMSMAAPVDYGNQMNQMRSSYGPQTPAPQYGKGGKVSPSKKK